MKEKENNDFSGEKIERIKEKPGMFRRIVSIICWIIVALVAITTIFSSFYTVNEAETAVVTSFGKAKLVEEKGLHFLIPFYQEVQKVDTTVRGFEIGYYEDETGTYYEVPEESIMITSDFNLLDVDFYISYQVSDPIKYLYASDNPQEILKDIAMSSIRSVVSAYGVDSAITTGKAGIQTAVKDMIMENLMENDIGLMLVDAAIQDVEPPTDSVINAFKDVETAKQGKESAINEANAYRNQKLPEAEANADKILQNAEAEKTARINEAKGQVARFNAEYAEYKNYPLITKQRMFYEAMQKVMPGLRIIINGESGDDGVAKYFSLDDLNTVRPAVLDGGDANED